eukprot:7379437-Prymnesium_polylepis.2
MDELRAVRSRLKLANVCAARRRHVHYDCVCPHVYCNANVIMYYLSCYSPPPPPSALGLCCVL